MDKIDTIKQQVEEFVAEIPPKFEQLTQYAQGQLPKDFESYINQLKSINKDELIKDLTEMKVTPVTITIGVVGLTTFLLLSKVLFGSSSTVEEKPKKKKKKMSNAQKANKSIQEVLDKIETTWVPEIEQYFESYKDLKPSEVDYKYNYFQEMLLKELLALDGIDTLGNGIIRENRRKVIKFIQDHQKRLDAFKKELDL